MIETLAERADEERIQYRSFCAKCGARRIDQQLGLEATPAEYVERMVRVFREVWRVLRDDGTCWVNMGDSYNSPNSHSGNTEFMGHQRVLNGKANNPMTTKTLKPKDLCGIPWRLAFALQADGWYLRSEIIWAKKNCMPESVTDRPTKSHEHLFLFAKSLKYYYDAEAVREAVSDLQSDSSDDGVLSTPESEWLVESVPKMQRNSRSGVAETTRESQTPSRSRATVASIGLGESDQEQAGSLFQKTSGNGGLSQNRGWAASQSEGAGISEGPGAVGSVLPCSADVAERSVNVDGLGMVDDQEKSEASVSILRQAETAVDDGPCDSPEQGRDAHEGQRGRSVQALQQSKARSSSGRNLRDVWFLPTEAYPGAHFATYPRKLIEPCIKAGTSERGVCPKCGRGWEREDEVSYIRNRSGTVGFARNLKEPDGRRDGTGMAGKPSMSKITTTLAWHPACSCNESTTVPAVVFDPFIGSGTTIVVANALGRQGVGLDLSREYLGLAQRRITRPHAGVPRPARAEHHPLFDREES